ncbi:MAG: enoyl-CoA hydratase-related protein [Hyphomonadaceae bacterium]
MRITLNREAALNAFTPTMCEELVSAFERASADDAVAAIVVTGKGRVFCAGMDLSADGNVFGLNEDIEIGMEELIRRQNEPEILTGIRDTGGRVALAIRACRKPVLAAINGAAVGIGATMTLAMDVRLMAEGARIGFVFGRIGITPEACSTWYLPRLVGLQKALEWVYSADLIGAEEAKAERLVRSVHTGAELLAEAHALAIRFTANKSRAATAVAREMLLRNAGAGTPLDAHFMESLVIHFLSQRDGMEGIAAFREKRPPQFKSGASDKDLPPSFPWPD